MTDDMRVYLVGAGPGDPDLLTVKALRLLQTADVVVYDRLVSPEILSLIPAGVTRIAVGKMPGHHCVPQENINELLASLAAPDRIVVRLKGGDPYIFGRGSEEALYLLRRGIGFEVVPGITAAAACSAYAGIPLTHRGLARGVRFVTGHLRNDEALELDWSGLADPETTLVVYMGLAHARQISERLIAAGLPADTPAAAIQEGTTPRQRRLISTLGELPEAAEAAGLSSPVVLVIGRVVELADALARTSDARATFSGPPDGQTARRGGATRVPPWQAAATPRMAAQRPAHREHPTGPGSALRLLQRARPFAASRALIRDLWDALNEALASFVLATGLGRTRCPLCPRCRTVRFTSIVLLLLIPLTASSAPDAARQDALRALVAQDCGACHGLTLKGGLGPALTPQALAGKPDALLLSTVLDGRPGTAMPPWRPFLSEAEARWIIEQLRAREIRP